MQDNPSYDESAAYSYQHDSYKYLPCDMDVISWLGAYFVKSEMYEKVVHACVCVCVCLCVCVCVCVCIEGLQVHMYICTRTHMCIYNILTRDVRKGDRVLCQGCADAAKGGQVEAYGS
jgi:hypothetical protein